MVRIRVSRFFFLFRSANFCFFRGCDKPLLTLQTESGSGGKMGLSHPRKKRKIRGHHRLRRRRMEPQEPRHGCRTSGQGIRGRHSVNAGRINSFDTTNFERICRAARMPRVRGGTAGRHGCRSGTRPRSGVASRMRARGPTAAGSGEPTAAPISGAAPHGCEGGDESGKDAASFSLEHEARPGNMTPRSTVAKPHGSGARCGLE